MSKRRILGKIKQILSSSLALALLVSSLPTGFLTAKAEGEAEEINTVVEPAVVEYYNGADYFDHDAAIEGYIMQQLYGYGISTLSVDSGIALTDDNAVIYEALAPQIKAVAAGQVESTEFTVPVQSILGQTTFTDRDLGMVIYDPDTETWNNDAYYAVYDLFEYDLDAINRKLVSDMPYELYWYDKTAGAVASLPAFYLSYDSTGGMISFDDNAVLTFTFAVAEEYSDGTQKVFNFSDGTSLTINTGVNHIFGTSIQNAVANARDIVALYAGYSDYDKLWAYAQGIIGLVDYNYDAAEDDTTPYGNPWQLIWVFDGDPDTKVVCEGFAKAFQYLCDMSTFEDPELRVYCVSGTMTDATSSGPHMWNMVNLGDDYSYLVDVTVMEGVEMGQPFMAGGLTTEENGLFAFYNVWTGDSYITYYYDGEMWSLYTWQQLLIAEMDYDPNGGYEEPDRDYMMDFYNFNSGWEGYLTDNRTGISLWLNYADVYYNYPSNYEWELEVGDLSEAGFTAHKTYGMDHICFEAEGTGTLRIDFSAEEIAEMATWVTDEKDWVTVNVKCIDTENDKWVSGAMTGLTVAKARARYEYPYFERVYEKYSMTSVTDMTVNGWNITDGEFTYMTPIRDIVVKNDIETPNAISATYYDDGWQLYFNDFGHAQVTFVYDLLEGCDDEFGGEQTFDYFVVRERMSLQLVTVDEASNVVPGGEIDLFAYVNVSKYVDDDGWEHYEYSKLSFTENPHYGLEWELESSSPEGVSLVTDLYDITRCRLEVSKDTPVYSYIAVKCSFIYVDDFGRKEYLESSTRYVDVRECFTSFGVGNHCDTLVRSMPVVVRPEVYVYTMENPHGILVSRIDGAVWNYSVISERPEEIEVEDRGDGSFVLNGIIGGCTIYYSASVNFENTIYADKSMYLQDQFNLGLYCYVQSNHIWLGDNDDIYYPEGQETVDFSLNTADVYPLFNQYTVKVSLDGDESSILLGENIGCYSNREGNNTVVSVYAKDLDRIYDEYDVQELWVWFCLKNGDVELSKCCMMLRRVVDSSSLTDTSVMLMVNQSNTLYGTGSLHVVSKDYPYGCWFNYEVVSVIPDDDSVNKIQIEKQDDEYIYTPTELGNVGFTVNCEYVVDGVTYIGSYHVSVEVVPGRYNIYYHSLGGKYEIVPGSSMDLTADCSYIYKAEGFSTWHRDVDNNDGVYVEWYVEEDEYADDIVLTASGENNAKCSVQVSANMPVDASFCVKANLVTIAPDGAKIVLAEDSRWFSVREAVVEFRYNTPSVWFANEELIVKPDIILFTQDKPEGINAYDIKGVNIRFTYRSIDIASGRELKDGGVAVTLPEGFWNFVIEADIDFSGTEYAAQLEPCHEANYFDVHFSQVNIGFEEGMNEVWMGDDVVAKLYVNPFTAEEAEIKVYLAPNYEIDPETEGYELSGVNTETDGHIATVTIDGTDIQKLYDEGMICQNSVLYFCLMRNGKVAAQCSNMVYYRLEDFGLYGDDAKILVGEDYQIPGTNYTHVITKDIPDGGFFRYTVTGVEIESQELFDDNVKGDLVSIRDVDQDGFWSLIGLNAGTGIIKVSYSIPIDGKVYEGAFRINLFVVTEKYSIEAYPADGTTNTNFVPGQSHRFRSAVYGSYLEDDNVYDILIPAIFKVSVDTYGDTNLRVRVEENNDDTFTVFVDPDSGCGTFGLVYTACDPNNEERVLEIDRREFYITDWYVDINVDYNAGNLMLGQSMKVTPAWNAYTTEHPEGYHPEDMVVDIWTGKGTYDVVNNGDGSYTLQRVSTADDSFNYGVFRIDSDGERYNLTTYSAPLRECLDKMYEDYYSEEGVSLAIDTIGFLYMHYYMTVPANMTQSLTVNVWDDVTGKKMYSEPLYHFDWEYCGQDTYRCQIGVPICSDEMSKKIRVTLTDSEGNELVTSSCSAKEYLEQLLNDSTGQYADWTELAKSILNYGAYAEEYFGTEVDAPANSSLSDTDRVVPLLTEAELGEMDATIPELTLGGLKYYGSSLLLRSGIGVRLYFTVAEDDSADDYRIGTWSLLHKDDNLYYVDYVCVGYDCLRAAWSIRVDKTDDSAYGDMIYSIGGYIRQAYKSQNADDKLLRLISAMCKLGTELNEREVIEE